MYPDHTVTIYEKTSKVLGKVKISGGGRCNVTHAVFNPKELVKFYPRGEKELLGPFTQFQPGDTIHWFEQRGVELKAEEDGRMFPVTDKSQTIIDCFENERRKWGVDLRLNHNLDSIRILEKKFVLKFENGMTALSDLLVITSGSSEKIWKLISDLGHSIIKPVPSLFTFNINDSRLSEYAGVSWPNAQIKLIGTKIKSTGAVLITHWGLSGPAILRLSAVAARELSDLSYQASIEINFLYPFSSNEVKEQMTDYKIKNPNKLVFSFLPMGFTQRIWMAWLTLLGFSQKRWQEMSYSSIILLSEFLTKAHFKMNGKSTFKEEFVTSGGVALKEIDMKTMQSKLIPNLFFAGEVLDIDAVTGGFNFQAAWTTGWIAGSNE